MFGPAIFFGRKHSGSRCFWLVGWQLQITADCHVAPPLEDEVALGHHYTPLKEIQGQGWLLLKPLLVILWKGVWICSLPTLLEG